MFRGRLKCLLFLILLRKQCKFEIHSVTHILLLHFNEQVRVRTSVFDPMNLRGCNAGVPPLPLAAQKAERSVGAGQEVSLAALFNFGNSSRGGSRCGFGFSWTFLRDCF